MNRISKLLAICCIAVPLAGCEEPKPLSTGEIIKQVNASGKITDSQAESLSKVEGLGLDGLTSMTDTQAERLSKVENLGLNGLTSITDSQAESLSKVESLHISEALQTLIEKYKNQ